MASQAAEDGIEVVCATPHIRPDHNVAIAELPSCIAELQAELRRAAIPVRIASGGEVSQSVACGLTDEELRSVSLAGGGWILLEPGPGPLGPELLDTVEALRRRGHGAVIAHPERHVAHGFEGHLRALAARGALIQWTAEFVAGAADDDLVLRCARDGLVHLLGSDAHSAVIGRPVRLSPAVRRLQTVCSAARLARIERDTPRAVLGMSAG